VSLRLALAAVLGLALTLPGCGRKGDPEPPSGKQAPTRSYPKPEPVPGAPPPEPKKT
jgi:predicted small lipoprotein YifL